MKNALAESIEHLLRVRVSRRGKPVELCVHYERRIVNGCYTFRLFSVEELDESTSTN
jgi:hypothetical protein